MYPQDPVHETTPFFSQTVPFNFNTTLKYLTGATSLEERFNLRYAQSLKSFELKKGPILFFLRNLCRHCQSFFKTFQESSLEIFFING
jgi:hypothetical protein